MQKTMKGVSAIFSFFGNIKFINDLFLSASKETANERKN